MLNVELVDTWRKDWLENLNWEEFSKHWPLATDAEKPTSMYNVSGPCRVTVEEATALAAMGVELKVVPLPGMMVTKMTTQHAWEYGTNVVPKDVIEGNAVQIVVPDMNLMWIDEVSAETDFCTDALQGMLDEGWRILAVCPPNAQRRPDYILGRRKHPKMPFDAR